MHLLPHLATSSPTTESSSDESSDGHDLDGHELDGHGLNGHDLGGQSRDGGSGSAQAHGIRSPDAQSPYARSSYARSQGSQSPGVRSNVSRRKRNADATGDDGDEDDDGGATHPRKKRNPWNSIMRLDTLSLSVEVEKIMSATDPVKSLIDDNSSLVHSFQESMSIADAFLARYHYTVLLDKRHLIDQLRNHFVSLLYFDLLRLIQPRAKATRLGHLQRDELQKFLGAETVQVVRRSENSIIEMTNRLNKHIHEGRKLHQLGRLLGGDGYIFYLLNELTPNLLVSLQTLNALACD